MTNQHDIDDIRKELAKLAGSTVILPDGAVVEFIEPSGDAFKAYQDAVDRASDEISKAVAGRYVMPIVEPIDRDKAWDALVINGNAWPPKDVP